MIAHDLVEADRASQAAAVPEQRDLEHGAVFDAVEAVDETREAGLELVGVELGEKAEPAEVHAKDRDTPRSRQLGAREKRAVAAEREYQVGLFQESVGRVGGDVARNLDRLDAAVLDLADGMVDHRLVRAWPAHHAELHHPSGRRWTKTSRLPPAPVTSDGASPITANPLAEHQSRNRPSPASIAAGSRTMPPLPTSDRPPWTCGLTRAPTSACAGSRRAPGATFSTPLHEPS